MRELVVSLVVLFFVLACSSERIQRLATSESIFQDVRALVVDSNNVAYVLTYATPSLLHEVNLNNFRLLRTAVLGGNNARRLVLDNARRRLYIGFDTNPGYVLKFSLENWAVEANLTTFHSARSLVLDDQRNILYVATYPPVKGLTGVVHKVNATNMAVVDTIELPAGYRARTIVYDTSRYYLYVGNDAAPASITRIWGEPALQLMDVLTFPKGWEDTSTSVIDANNQFAYFGISSPVGRIAKIDLSNFQWVDTISTAGNSFDASAIDNVRGYSYWISRELPASLYRVRLCDFTLVDIEAFTPADGVPKALAVRQLTGVITLGTSCLLTTPCRENTNSLIKLQVTSPAVCEKKQVAPRSENVYQTTVNMRFAGMVPSPSCCPPPEFFNQEPRLLQTCK
eukprot:TRINITY_DN2581_c0_g1_i1.p1 TRINITY_DN2581_c0_g1~~TRINITY_DN2581_c0_g1_i1.p1  ORF type:complete len:421 (+),score=129.84 TRINITY_DN2581_c0_g1_i1:70-1263(+)